MINATQIRKGMMIKLEGNLYKVLEAPISRRTVEGDDSN